MAKYRSHLPQLDAEAFLTDGGLETSLIYDEGLELPDFAAFTLYADEFGRDALDRYFDEYARIAVRDGVGVVLETATWRANPDWGARLGYDTDRLAEVNRAAVEHLVGVRQRHETPSSPIVISGNIGPRGDGYQVGELMSATEAAEYHSLQTSVFASTEADLVTALTMTYSDEAIGVAQAARAAGMPVVLSFTVETDGSLPSGQSLPEAIDAVDAATAAYPAYYMVNCAHPDHFASVFTTDTAWTRRVGGVRANASRKSHAELDEATELDAGDPVELSALFRALREAHPSIVVLGGCCGTNHVHIDAISRANVATAG